jgi:hypothetical protein
MSSSKDEAIQHVFSQLQIEKPSKKIKNIVIQDMTNEQRNLIEWVQELTNQKTATKAIFIGLESLQKVYNLSKGKK